jgi:hypothetical protein
VQGLREAGAAPLLVRLHWQLGRAPISPARVNQVRPSVARVLEALGVGAEVVAAHRHMVGLAGPAGQEEAEAAVCCGCGAVAGAAPRRGKFQRCAGCRLVRYCSAECQKAHWRLHKVLCRLARGK